MCFTCSRVGNRYGARGDEFSWHLGVKRRLKRYVQSGLTNTEMALLLGVSRGAVAGAIHRFHLKHPPEIQREYQRRQSYERAKHGKRSVDSSWDARLIESWEDRKKRLARERAK